MESTGWAVARFVAVEPAEEALLRAGYQVYCPKFRRRLIGVRIDASGRRIRTRGLGSMVLRPLFPTYLLVGWPDGGLRERPIKHAGGRLLRYPLDAAGQALPKLLSLETVADLRARVDAGEFDMGPRKKSARPLQRWFKVADPAWRELLAAAV